MTAKPFTVQTAESAPVQQPADSSTNLLKDQLSVVQPTFIHFEQPSEILAAYSLTRPQFPVQLTNPLFDCQPAVLQEHPLTVQIPLVKDWACMIKEWINILSLLNEKNQVSVHNAQELIPEDVRSEPDVEKQNLESGLPINTAAIPRGIFE